MDHKTKVLGATISLVGITAGGGYVAYDQYGTDRFRAVDEIRTHEGYRSKPYIPVPGDRPTIGYGNTFLPDGTPVTLNHPPINKQIAAEYLTAHNRRNEDAYRKTIANVMLTPSEYEIYYSFVYQYGLGNWNKSSMLRHLQNGDNLKACNAMLAYKYYTGRRLNYSATLKPGAQVLRKYEATNSKGERVTFYDVRYDCSAPGSKVCSGVWNRLEERYKECLTVQTDF